MLQGCPPSDQNASTGGWHNSSNCTSTHGIPNIFCTKLPPDTSQQFSSLYIPILIQSRIWQKVTLYLIGIWFPGKDLMVPRELPAHRSPQGLLQMALTAVLRGNACQL